jgi:hypothetical protein
MNTILNKNFTAPLITLFLMEQIHTITRTNNAKRTHTSQGPNQIPILSFLLS